MQLADLTDGGSLLPITRWGEPVMHAPTAAVDRFDAELHELVRNMFATMEAAQGVGLAATQVGLSASIFVFDCPDKDDKYVRGVVCNPVVALPSGNDRNLVSQDEGCLSLPGGYAPLARPDYAVCTGLDAFGEPITIVGTGLLARCLQHETDHLGGIVFGDRLSARTRRQLYAQAEELSHLYPDDWPATPKHASADE
jgi:peptide deformylase